MIDRCTIGIKAFFVMLLRIGKFLIKLFCIYTKDCSLIKINTKMKK